MDQLLEILINAIIALFSGNSSQQAVQRPAVRPPSVRPVPPKMVVRPVPQRPAVRPKQMTAQVPRVAPPPVKPPPPPPPAIVPPKPVAASASPRVDAAALRRWMRPQVMRSQFILTEILQPPLALRQTPRNLL